MRGKGTSKVKMSWWCGQGARRW